MWVLDERSASSEHLEFEKLWWRAEWQWWTHKLDELKGDGENREWENREWENREGAFHEEFWKQLLGEA